MIPDFLASIFRVKMEATLYSIITQKASTRTSMVCAVTMWCFPAHKKAKRKVTSVLKHHTMEVYRGHRDKVSNILDKGIRSGGK
jgi:hypothetical protein